MPHPFQETNKDTLPSSRFPETRWSVVRRVKTPSEREQMAALSDLCQAYWKPLYCWARYRGLSNEDASDGVQGFFALILSNSALTHAEESRGRFRNFMLTSFRNHLENERIKHAAKKRGGEYQHLSFDEIEADEFYKGCSDSLHDESDATIAFDRSWALTILAKAEGALQSEFRNRSKTEIYTALRPFLEYSNGGSGYQAAAESIGMKPAAFRVALFRLRKRFAQLVVDQVRDTVDSEEKVSEEMSTLYAALSNDS